MHLHSADRVVRLAQSFLSSIWSSLTESTYVVSSSYSSADLHFWVDIDHEERADGYVSKGDRCSCAHFLV